jgi:hypothetical protein
MALPFSHQFPTSPFGNRVPKAQQQIIIQGSNPFVVGIVAGGIKFKAIKKAYNYLQTLIFILTSPRVFEPLLPA